MEIQRSTDAGEPQSSQSVRWHPALLRQDEQSSYHNITRPGAAAWPGRIVGVHRMQPPATTGPFADVRREFCESTREAQSAWVSTAAPASAHMHAPKEPQRCFSAPVESTEELSRLRTHQAASCSRSGMHNGPSQHSRLHPTSSTDTAAARSILRFDSASSVVHLQQDRGGSAFHAGSHLVNDSQQNSGHQDLGFERRSWGSDGSDNSTGTRGGHTGAQLAERWDSAHSDSLALAISSQQELGLQEQSLRHREQRRRAQQQQLAAMHDEAMPTHLLAEHSSSMHDTGGVPADMLEDEEEDEWRPRAPRAAGPHVLATEDRVRQPRRRRSTNKPPPRARRCLSAAFAAAADAARLQPLDDTPTHSAPCPLLPTCCPSEGNALPQLSRGHQGGSAEGMWQPGGLWELLLEAPMGLAEEAARAVIANVACALESMHGDGLVHRHVSVCTVVLGESPCFDTARLSDGGCTAVLDCTGSFSDTAKVGNPLYQAPEVLRAFPDANILYTPSGDMWSLGVLLFVLLTGAAPPFEKLLGQGGWAGLCVDTWQRRVSDWLCAALHARQPPTPIARSAQVLLQALLQVDPAQRLTAAQVCAHPWVLGLPPLTFSITVDTRGPGLHLPAHAAAGGSGAADSVEGTLQAMQRLWLQQPPPFQGGYGSQVDALGARDGRNEDATEQGRVGEKAASSAVGWLQRFLGRCKRPSGKELMASDDLTALILHHY